MSLREIMMDKQPEEKSQARDNKRPHRLYPSLPNVDSYEICKLDGSIGEKLHEAAEFCHDRLLEDTQLEVSAAKDDARLTAQILILERQREEVISLNKRWAKEYQTMVCYYKQKVQDLKTLLHCHFEEGACEARVMPIASCKKLKTLKGKDDTQAGDVDVGSELLAAEKKVQSLHAQNSTLARRGQHQHEEIKRLNKALEEALLTSAPPGISSETQQDVWKHQAEVYKEDFLTERKDREKLKEKYLELESQFRKARRELRVLKSQVTCTQPPQVVLECTHRVKRPNNQVDPRRERS
ncbi:TNFAIP3-interacting protein 1-like [Solea solea]|uniref:TNFAIP3-interacting protein 1-like n=1 Tax=Solea solea TaxID=90069 RepID=UPI002729B3EF|nr:TNFAIP3-interacting protein 1-like [Solea solea]